MFPGPFQVFSGYLQNVLQNFLDIEVIEANPEFQSLHD